MQHTSDCSLKHSLSTPDKVSVCYASVSEHMPKKQAEKKINNVTFDYTLSKQSNKLEIGGFLENT